MEMRIHGRHLERVCLPFILSSVTLLLLIPIPTPPQAREICMKFTRGVDFNWQGQALLALQEVRRGSGTTGECREGEKEHSRIPWGCL